VFQVLLDKKTEFKNSIAAIGTGVGEFNKKEN
jgi:hypothetical protein